MAVAVQVEEGLDLAPHKALEDDFMAIVEAMEALSKKHDVSVVIGAGTNDDREINACCMGGRSDVIASLVDNLAGDLVRRMREGN